MKLIQNHLLRKDTFGSNRTIYPIHVLLIKRRLLPTQKAYFHQNRIQFSEKKSQFTNNVDKFINDKKWNSLKTKIHQTKTNCNATMLELLKHLRFAKHSIQEANKKLLEQEKEASDKRLTYNTDLQTNDKIENLPSERELHRRTWSRKLEFYLDSLQETIFTATKALNDVTGYSGIQKLRNSIELMESQLESTKQELKATKLQHLTSKHRKDASQKKLNELLQRKSTWSPSDLEIFTKVYKEDANNLKEEERLKVLVNEIEIKQEQLNDDLYRAILTRYHEEQIWSDKIRRTSTWGTFILMGVNILLFTVFQLLLEPWKRRRLTRSFEDKVKVALEQFSKDHVGLVNTPENSEDGEKIIQEDNTLNMTKSVEVLKNPTEKKNTLNDANHIPVINEINEYESSKISIKDIRSLNDLFDVVKYAFFSSMVIINSISARFRNLDLSHLNAQNSLRSLDIYIFSGLSFLIGTVFTSLLRSAS
ncbi:hypothetical protein TBLA_0D01870 [Henningerozyma blattae CBS 6284]|uniref:Sensitive to high expression protein 9, mitochondrial n=1 Tax=Henningerozyma blattae (strain ATCC 34711 / CBS 6284 / DSM 70876 / NBRC 10599 / NRRL Y-10934 / UCD 77-7) TaxID=1071380 RepID=I2H2U2_HENB6|nr:hypothetical protein TBLA_0D01870 [Tetrapisispora blattae CBS 6284]CCH60694.1 hypothetical protein TBLA_0D01870 [Tetrapisispora blattae CBS 6284]